MDVINIVATQLEGLQIGCVAPQDGVGREGCCAPGGAGGLGAASGPGSELNWRGAACATGSDRAARLRAKLCRRGPKWGNGPPRWRFFATWDVWDRSFAMLVGCSQLACRRGRSRLRKFKAISQSIQFVRPYELKKNNVSRWCRRSIGWSGRGSCSS